MTGARALVAYPLTQRVPDADDPVHLATSEQAVQVLSFGRLVPALHVSLRGWGKVAR